MKANHLRFDNDTAIISWSLDGSTGISLASLNYFEYKFIVSELHDCHPFKFQKPPTTLEELKKAREKRLLAKQKDQQEVDA